MEFRAFAYRSFHIDLDLSSGEIIDLLYILDTADSSLSIAQDLAVQLRKLAVKLAAKETEE